MTKKCSVCIDESGDLGVGRGTEYFVISAVVVDDDEVASIRKTISDLKRELNVNKIHLRETRDFFKKAVIVRELEKHPFTYMNVIINTNQLSSKDYTHTYNFACRMLLERVSWFMRDTDRVGNIILSARGTSRDNELIEYIKSRLFNSDDPSVQIEPKVFDGVTAKTAGSWDLLSVADVCATTMFNAYQRNRYGFTEPCFSKALKSHLYSYKGSISNYGLKYYDQQMIPNFESLREYAICRQK